MRCVHTSLDGVLTTENTAGLNSGKWVLSWDMNGFDVISSQLEQYIETTHFRLVRASSLKRTS